MIYHKKILSNGLRLITIPMPSFESATVLILVGAGSRYETKKNNGISHFLEHMAFKGTEKRPSAVQISELIDGIGGEFNAFTGKETTGFYIKSAAAHIDLSMDVLSDMLQRSLLDAGEIEKEKGVIMEEINLYEDMPVRKIGDVYERLLYGNTPMGWDIAGEKDIIMSITRQDFVAYMSSLYSADNITVVVAGGIDEAKTEKMVDRYFGNMKRFDTEGFIKVVDKQKKPEVLIKQKKTEQVHIALGVRTVPVNHKDHYALGLLASILGGGMSSRLFSEVREKRGLAYYVRTHSDHSQDCGSLVSVAGVDPKRVDEAVEVITAEYKKISTGSSQISNEELRKAKEFSKGHFVLELEDSRSVASFYAHQELLEEKIDNPDEILVKIEETSKEHVEEVARKYLSRPLNLAIIGNFEDKERFEKLISV